MGRYDRHVREINGDIVQVNGLRVFQPQAAAPPHARADGTSRQPPWRRLVFGACQSLRLVDVG